MSLSQLIHEVRRAAGDELGDRLAAEVARYHPDSAYWVFAADRTQGNLDTLRTATARHFTPFPGQEKAFSTDLKRWSAAVSALLAAGQSIDHYVEMYPRLFNPNGKTHCGYLRSRCDWPPGAPSSEACRYKFRDSTETFVCPECGAVRRLCTQPAATNGRCRHHGSRVPYGLANGKTKDRTSLIAASIKSPRLREAFLSVMNDPNPLSVMSLVGPLFGRYVELLSELDELNPAAIERGVSQSVAAMERAAAKEDWAKVVHSANTIQNLLEAGRSNRSRWAEIGNVSGSIARLIDTERRNLVDRQQMITLQEMTELQHETIEMVRRTMALAAGVIHQMISRGSPVTADEIKTALSTTFSEVMRREDQRVRMIVQQQGAAGE